MEKTILSLNADGYFVHFAFLVAIGLALGIIVYVISKHPGTRREQFRNFSAIPLPISLILGLAVAIPIIIYAYISSWSYFYSIGTTNGTIIIGYHFPKRTVFIDITNQIEITDTIHIGKSGPKYRLKIATPDGSQYFSQLISKDRAEAATLHLNNIMKR